MLLNNYLVVCVPTMNFRDVIIIIDSVYYFFVNRKEVNEEAVEDGSKRQRSDF
jgi:hypothetical protein